ncbi:MAG: type II toxin-antitoxin system RelE/ParE family toxin [Bacteroidia bacterium]
MAKKVIWSKDATIDLFEILEYFNFRNRSKNYSSKLYRQLRASASLIGRFPLKGKRFEGKDIRYVVSGAYMIFYRIVGNNIEIINIWDSRRNPDELASRLG